MVRGDLTTPDVDRRLLDPAPVRRVTCQLRFDESDEISTSALGREWAARLGETFPRFDQLQGEILTISGNAEQGPEFGRTRERGWRFADDEQSTVITLLPSSVALETTAYSRWEDFRDTFHNVLDLLDTTVNPAVEQRLGLRYVNELAGANSGVEQEVDRELLGVAAHNGLGGRVRRLEQRAIIDLDDESLRGTLRFQSASEDAASLLDIDVYREMGRPFDVGDVVAILENLNTHSLYVFQECLDDEYLDQLRLGEDEG